MRRRRAGRAPQYESETYRDLQRRLAANVRRLRTQRAWTQEMAAHAGDMSTRLLQRVENGEVNLTLTSLARLCQGLGADVCELLAPLARRSKAGKTRAPRAVPD